MKGLLITALFILLPAFEVSFGQNIPTEADIQKSMEAFNVGNNILKGLEKNQYYIRVLNELLDHPEYFDVPNYLDMLAWGYTYNGHYDKGIELGDKAFPKPKKRVVLILMDTRV